MPIDCENIDGLKKTLIHMAENINEKTEIALNKAALRIERDAKQKCPKDTGALRASIGSQIELGQNVVAVTVGTNVPYAPFVEYGTGLFAKNGDGRKDVPWWYMDAEGKFHITRGQHPQPFLIPAFLENRDYIIECFKEAIKND